MTGLSLDQIFQSSGRHAIPDSRLSRSSWPVRSNQYLDGTSEDFKSGRDSVVITVVNRK